MTSYNINTKVVTTIRELKPDDLYVRVSATRRYGPDEISRHFRRRTSDPFWSKTLLGSKVGSAPSEKVHPVLTFTE